MDDEGAGHAAFVYEVFVESKGRIRSIGPDPAASGSGCPAGALRIAHGFFIARAENAAFLAGSVVGQEEDNRVVVLVQRFQLPHEFADVLVDRIDAGGIGGHTQILDILLLVGK